MLTVKSFTFNPFTENTYILYNENKNALIIDPGCSNPSEQGILDAFIKENSLNVEGIFLTHTHIDHVLGLAHTKKTYGVDITAHTLAPQGLSLAEQVGKLYGIPIDTPPSIDQLVEEGDEVNIGGDSLKVLFSPGHAPDHVVLYAEADQFCMVGDVIFQGSIGRTDLPGGDYDTLIQSIQTKIITLPPQTLLFSGHGMETNVETEIKFNPFLK